MEVTKIFKFDSAHYLPNHKGKCKRLHGHTYELHITIKGLINNEGFVIDFGILKELITPLIDLLDHNYLNDIIDNPTCENLLLMIEEWIKNNTDLTISKLKLYETPTSYAELKLQE